MTYRILLALFLLRSFLCSTLYSTQGSTFSWAGFQKIWLDSPFMILSNTSSQIPYFTIEDRSPQLYQTMQIKSYFNHSWLDRFVHLQTQKFTRIRADSGYDTSLQITQATTNETRTFISIVYMRVLPTGNYYFLDFHVYNQCYSICSPTSLTPINISLGGVAFNLTRDNLFPNFEVWHLNRSPSPSPSTFYFSANELSQKLISNGIITPYDQMCNLAIVITLSMEVTHDISLVDSYPNRTNIYEDDRITLENLTIFNDYCLAVPFQSSDYSNISYYKSNPSLFGTICDFSYFSSTGNQKLKNIQHVVFGFYKNQWVTPPGDYLLPLELSATALFAIDFSYVQQDLVPYVGKSACITLLLRQDYDNVSRSFPYLELNRTEIRVCSGWSSSLQRPTEYLRMVVFQQRLYRLYREVQDKGSMQVIAFTFIDTVPNSNNFTEFDAFAFVRYLCGVELLDRNRQIAAVSIGFRLYAGKGLSIFRQAAFQSKLITTDYDESANVTDIGLMQCFLMKMAPEEQYCYPSPALYMSLYYLLSTPTLPMLLRITPLAVFLDEFSYYSYHAAPYDLSFQAFADLAWNLTNAKWLPAFISDYYSSYANRISQVLSVNDNRPRNPQVLVAKGENVFFLNMTCDFWTWSLPLSLLCFSCLCFARKRSSYSPLKKLLNPYTVFGYFLCNLLVDNMLFFGFRSAMQLRFLVVSPAGLILSTFNIILTIVALWFLSCVGIALPTFLYRWSRPHQTEHFGKSLGSYMLLSCMQVIRAFTGFVHASSITALPRLVALTGLLLLSLCLITIFRRLVPRRNWRLQLTTYIIKLCLHGLLLAELSQNGIQNDLTANRMYNVASVCFLGALLGMLVLAYLIEILIEFYRITQLIHNKVFPKKQIAQMKANSKSKIRNHERNKRAVLENRRLESGKLEPAKQSRPLEQEQIEELSMAKETNLNVATVDEPQKIAFEDSFHVFRRQFKLSANIRRTNKELRTQNVLRVKQINQL